MNRPPSGRSDTHSPYVWIRSQRLRNPHNPPTPSSTSRLPERQRRLPSSASSSSHTVREKQNPKPAHRRMPSAPGDSGGRRVKTAVSNELFQTGIQPAYIDHNGDLMDAGVDEYDSNKEETVGSRQMKERLKSSRTGWGVMIPPPPPEEDETQETPAHQHHHQDTAGNRSLSDTQSAQTSPHTVSFKKSQKQKRGCFHGKTPHATAISDIQQAAPSRPKSAVAAALDRAWTDNPAPPPRPITRGSCSSKFDDRTRNRSSSQVRHVTGRRTVSAYLNRRCPQTPQYYSSGPNLTQESSARKAGTSRIGHTRHTVAEKDPYCATGEGDKEINRIRPLTVDNVGDSARRYCDQRLQTIYARRRSKSAAPSSRRCDNTAGSGPAAPPTPTPESRQDQAELHSRDDLTRLLSARTLDIDEEEASRPLSQASVMEDDQRPETGRHHQAQSATLTPIARFRLVVWITVCLRRLLGEIIRMSGEKTLRSATELQWMAIYAEKHDASLAFNKHLFSRDRVMAHVPFWAQCILAIPPIERTEAQCRKLHALLRGMRSFDKFTDEIQMALCKAFILEKVEEGRIVLKNGHVGLNFYFIYSGSVFVNQEDETRQGRVFSRTVATLSRGDSFGELALLQDIRRTATVSVRERCELLMVDKDVFASVCPRIFDKELAEKHAFIKSLDLFSSSYWSSDAIHSLSMNSQIQEYKINKIIVGDSCLEDWIYICMMGKCQVIRVLSLKKASPEGEQPRKESDIVLSEEILQLLASAAGQATSGEPLDRGDSKENLLSSLQLDYVRTSKKLYLDNSQDVARQKALLGLNDATTLTAYIQQQRDLGKTDLVYLNVGVLEAGETFDLPSLLETEAIPGGGGSTLMLVSAGAKLVRIKKAAFQDQASQQALDNARTLASKQVNPTEKSILDSYKTKIAWEEFKASLVHDVKRRRKMRYQPLHRANIDVEYVAVDGQRKDRPHSAVGAKSSKIISALQSIHEDGEEFRRQSIARKSLGGRWARARPPPSVTFQRRRSLTLDDMRSGSKKELVISRRQTAGINNRRVSKEGRQEACR